MPAKKATDFVHPADSGCTLTIDASPGAPRTEIVGINPWRGALQVKIAAEPREGEANEELAAFLSKRLGVRRNDIRLIKGAKSGHKVLFVPLPADRVRALLESG